MKRFALRVAGIIFALVALIHLARLYFEFPMNIGTWNVPLMVNTIGFIVAGLLSFWMFLASKRKKWIPCGYHSLSPYITFKDSRKAIDFYKKSFGAKQKELVPGPNGQGVMFAEMKIGNSMFMMGDERSDQNTKSVETIGISPISFYLYVRNVDAFFKKAVEGGATVDMPLQDMFWGDRVCRLKDPFGYLWMVATHVKDVSQEEMKKDSETGAK